MARVFLTGATGYIGGTVLTYLISRHPEETYVILVRDPTRASELKAGYEEEFPGVKLEIIVGSLNDVDILEKAAEESDIVLNAADNDHKAAAEALVRGLTKRASDKKPAYLIHTSGTAVLEDEHLHDFGTTITTHVYDDYDRVHEITRDLRNDAWHREVDQVIISAGDEGKVKTTIVCPPTIYGFGTGLGRKTSAQIPLLINKFVQRGKGFVINQGKTMWNNVHVKDLAELYLILFEKALAKDEDKEVWGGDSYFLCEGGEHHWGNLSRTLAKILYDKGLVETPEVDGLTPEQAQAETQVEPAPKLWAANSRGKAVRARKLFGWKPKEVDIWSTLDEEVDYATKEN